MSIEYFIIFQYYGGSFPLDIAFFSDGIFLFSVVFVGGDLCVFYLLYLSLVCLFWACEFLEVSLAGRVIFSSVWDSAVWSVGPVQFI